MLLDILITIIALLIIVYGYRKGFMIQIINFILIMIYFYFANTYLEKGLELINNQELTQNIEANILYRYLIIVLLGIILFFIINFFLKKIFKLKLLSFINRIGGIIISVGIFYLIICFLNLIVFILQYYSYDIGVIQDSFYLGKQFNQYNLLLWWWLNG